MSAVETAAGSSTAGRGAHEERARLTRERQAAIRRRQRWHLLLGAAGTVLLGALLAVGAVLALELAGSAAGPGDAPGAGAGDRAAAAAEAAEGAAGKEAQPGGDGQRRLLLATVDEDTGPATSVTLLAGPTETAPASVLFLPTGTLVRVPGLGLEQLATALQYGGPELLQAAVENALSVSVDAVATADEAAFAEFLDRGGQLEVELGGRLLERDAAGGADVRFEAGAQRLDGAELAELWTLRSDDDEMGAFPRRQMILRQLLDAAGNEVVSDRLVADGAPGLGADVEPGWMRALFTDLSAAHTDGVLRFNLLPAERFGQAEAGGQRTFRIQEAETARLVDSLLDAGTDARAAAGSTSGVRAQVLNGVGSPGVGQLVDERLPDDVRIVLSGNASSFDHPRTKLVVYDEDPGVLAAAERVREALGAGTIQVSRQPQSIVDMTIVVGADLGSDD